MTINRDQANIVGNIESAKVFADNKVELQISY